MSVDIELSSAFGFYTNNVLNLKVEGNTIHEALQDLGRRQPKLSKVLLNEKGELQQSYDLFINGNRIYPRDASLALKNGDKVNILYIIHGG